MCRLVTDNLLVISLIQYTLRGVSLRFFASGGQVVGEVVVMQGLIDQRSIIQLSCL